MEFKDVIIENCKEKDTYGYLQKFTTALNAAYRNGLEKNRSEYNSLFTALRMSNRHYYERQIKLEDENKRLRKALSNARTDVCVKCGKRVEGIQCQECEYLYEMPRGLA